MLILFAKTKQPRHKQILNSIRGGSTTTSPISSDNQSPGLKWRMQQDQLLQLRSTFFSCFGVFMDINCDWLKWDGNSRLVN